MDGADDPLVLLGSWIEDARAAGLALPGSVAFVTATSDGVPSARTVSLKRIESGALLFTTALWTRKARELKDNPRVALLFHWQSLGRQVHVTGEIEWAERAVSEKLWAERDLANQLQTVVSRQGAAIEDLVEMRARHAHLMAVSEAAPPCPQDWGALRVRPAAIEFWDEAPNRLHDRLVYVPLNSGGWSCTRLSP